MPTVKQRAVSERMGRGEMSEVGNVERDESAFSSQTHQLALMLTIALLV